MTGELTLGGSTIPGEYAVPELIGAFRGKYPDVRISLLIGGSREVQSWVEDECRARLLAGVKIRELTITRAFHLITHRDRSHSPLAQAFLAFVESQAAGRSS